jgi:guanylate kinase
MNRVMARVGGLRQLPTATTRPQREGEQQGREHLFVSVDEFKHMLANDQLLEHQEVHGRYYGVPRSTVEAALDAGEDLIADIDYLGAAYTRSQYPDNVILIFVQPPSVQTLIQRMRTRGDNEAEICRRLLRVPAELAFAAECDYLIVNEDIEEASETLYGVVIAARSHREIMRLRGLGDQPNQSYATLSAAVVVYEDQVAWGEQTPYLPLTPVSKHETPSEAALRTVKETLGIELGADNLVHLRPPKPDLVPPASVDFLDSTYGQQVVLLYICRVPAQVDLPSGWAWRPQTEARLPQMIHDVLASLPT